MNTAIVIQVRNIRDRLKSIMETERNATDVGYKVSLNPSFVREILNVLDNVLSVKTERHRKDGKDERFK